MPETPLSIYVHIPFCASKCRYCDFYSIKFDSKLADLYIDALAEEWKLLCRKENLQDHNVITVYFGGGTPSILTARHWDKIQNKLISQFGLDKSIEWSVESNPESFNKELSDKLYQMGVNRLTFGIQSFNERELEICGRVHDSKTAFKVINDESLSKFRSIGADLIYGLPAQTTSTLKRSLSELVKSPYINHVSAYELTINQDTSFGRHQRILPVPDEDTVYEMTDLVRSFLQECGFEQYEVSNFAKPGFKCRHNSIYWEHRNYIGLGCAAHSYLHPYRWANVDNVEKYISKISSGELATGYSEFIDQQTLAHEMLFLGLRKKEGIDIVEFERRIGKRFDCCIDMVKINHYINRGWLVFNDSRYVVTDKGLLFADTMARELF